VKTALPSEALEIYESKSQQARVATEEWAFKNLYCPNCNEPRLTQHPANTPAVDFQCPNCRADFQLKAQSHGLVGKIVDAAYSSMVRKILENKTPNLYAMYYRRDEWRISDLILIPHFAFPLSAIEKRKPLAATARRAGWVGCNILLDAIPLDARIPVVTNGKSIPARQVREQYARLRPLEELSVEKRGWTLDVLNVVQSLRKKEFELADVYAHEHALARLHPGNRHIRDKIRQQLQVLRDAGLLQFLGGEYRLRPVQIHP
jgi:type II restriction enzyme